MADFKKLQVWQKAHALTLCVDRASKRIRGSQYLSLRNQMFRSAASIPANIAEGRRKKSPKEFARFLGITLGSASELENHLILARDTRSIPGDEFVSLADQTITVRKMLYALARRGAEDNDSTFAQTAADESPEHLAAPLKAPSR